jgi:hypothetical protein
MIKSRRIRWAGHVASMQRLEVYPELYIVYERERSDNLEDLFVDGRKILKWIGKE